MMVVHVVLDETRKVLFVFGWIQNGERHVVEYVANIEKLVVPYEWKIENIAADDIIVDMLGCSTHVSESEPDHASCIWLE